MKFAKKIIIGILIFILVLDPCGLKLMILMKTPTKEIMVCLGRLMHQKTHGQVLFLQ